MTQDSRDPRGPRSAGVSRVLAVVFATISFFALSILGTGALSFATNADIISVPGLGPAPGVVGLVVAVLVFVLSLAATLRREPPSYLSAPGTGLGCALAHLVAVWVVVAILHGDVIVATAAAGDLVGGGTSLVILLAALVAAWGGVALRRTKAAQPHWPWEDDEE